jgi:hypothetical protein
VRLEQLKDYNLAYGRWTQIAENIKGADGRRALFVLVRGRAHGLESSKTQPKDGAERAKLISVVIADAQRLLAESLPASKRKGRNLLRDIRDLYAGDSGDIGKLVEQAKRLLADNPTA